MEIAWPYYANESSNNSENSPHMDTRVEKEKRTRNKMEKHCMQYFCREILHQRLQETGEHGKPLLKSHVPPGMKRVSK
uniref:Uncharacterized protein n=1 Tax=Arion vulgaris TaxID=1028688 RepID=A0A0B7A4Z9_9EUPU